MWIYKTSHANTRCVWKWNGGYAFNNVLLHPWNVFYSYTIWTSKTSEKKTLKNNGRNNLELYLTSWFSKPWALVWAPFFCPYQLNFPPKWCHINGHLNLASIGLESSSKALGSNLWLSTNRNAPFCWTLHLSF
jgi:hypothetical protein